MRVCCLKSRLSYSALYWVATSSAVVTNSWGNDSLLFRGTWTDRLIVVKLLLRPVSPCAKRMLNKTAPFSNLVDFRAALVGKKTVSQLFVLFVCFVAHSQGSSKVRLEEQE